MGKTHEINEEDFRDVVTLCSQCSAIFKPGFKYQYRFPVGSMITSMDPEIISTCPNCGNPKAVSKNSLYDFVDESFKYLKTLGLPELIILRDTLTKYVKGEKTEEDKNEVIKSINENAPKLLTINDFIPRTLGDFIGYVGLLISILFGVIPLLEKKETQPTTVIFNNTYNSNIVEPVIIIDSTKIKPSRNTLCPCGSGKKFKRCHGLSK